LVTSKNKRGGVSYDGGSRTNTVSNGSNNNNRGQDEQNQERLDRTSIAWPEWMLRYVASDDQTAFNDLIWSVGGSPPYGGISYEEAAAVYDLLDQFYGRGQKMAPEEAYDRVRQYIQRYPDRLNALELFRCYDRIISSADNLSTEDVSPGLALCEKLGHIPAKAYFMTVAAQLLYRDGKIGKAKEILLDVLPTFLYLASQDLVYKSRALSTVQNAISFAAMDGDFSTARDLFAKLGHLFPTKAYEQLRSALGEDSSI
jgi:hypothetical protein